MIHNISDRISFRAYSIKEKLVRNQLCTTMVKSICGLIQQRNNSLTIKQYLKWQFLLVGKIQKIFIGHILHLKFNFRFIK